jgi:hypothetical protein
MRFPPAVTLRDVARTTRIPDRTRYASRTTDGLARKRHTGDERAGKHGQKEDRLRRRLHSERPRAQGTREDCAHEKTGNRAYDNGGYQSLHPAQRCGDDAEADAPQHHPKRVDKETDEGTQRGWCEHPRSRGHDHASRKQERPKRGFVPNAESDDYSSGGSAGHEAYSDSGAQSRVRHAGKESPATFSLKGRGCLQRQQS